MIFAPSLRRASFIHAPRASDAALQRFLLAAAQGNPVEAPVQVQQDDKAVTVQLDVPGLTREQLSITIELPSEIDAPASSAKLENGVLTLVLAKLQPESRATQLTIG